jgi:hypothetical protein
MLQCVCFVVAGSVWLFKSCALSVLECPIGLQTDMLSCRALIDDLVSCVIVSKHAARSAEPER